MKTLDDVSLSDLMPDSISGDPVVSASARSIDKELKLVAQGVDAPLIFSRIDELTSDQLDHLAASRNMTIWRDSWPVELKRSVAKQIIAQKARMGTLSAVKLALQSLGAAAVVTEWWEENPPAEAHTFKISVSLSEIDGTLTSEMQEDCFALLDDAKPVRSHYTFTLAINKQGGLKVGSVFRQAVSARIQVGRKAEVIGIVLANAVRPVVFNQIYN